MTAPTPPMPAAALAAPWPRWIAHRGAGRLAPENTLAAFRAGQQFGYRAFECDVQLSADGVPFLLHDDSLERTTSGQGIAGQQPWSTLAALDAGGWHGPAFRGEHLPTMADLAQELHRQDAWLDLEIKPSPGTDPLTGQQVALAATRLWPDEAARRRLILSSFSVPALQAAQQAAPELRRALLLDTLWPGWEAAATDLGVCAIITHHPLMSAALVQQLHAQARRALVYTVNDTTDAQRLLAWGVDGLITDAVDRFPAAAPG